eukprot:730279-Prorocentrum_lima.AAC.1
MTSSLVGSEMCIRDRKGTSLLSASCSLAHLGARSEQTSQSPNGSSTFLAVSYTHLTLPTICSV